MPSTPSSWVIPETAKNYIALEFLLEACRNGVYSRFLMLESRIEPEKKPPLSYLVHLAANSRSHVLTRHLLAQYPPRSTNWTNGQPDDLPCSQKNAYINSAIISAIERGDGEVLQAFLDAGLNADSHIEYNWNGAMDYREWILGIAIISNHPDLVLRCCKAGANINKRGGYESALGLAADARHPSMVRFLVEHGAIMHGSLALWFAAQRGDIEMGRLLLELGADINEIHFEIDYTWDDQEETPWTIRGTALHAALHLEQYAFAEWLIESGIDTSLKNGYNQTAEESVRDIKLPGDKL